MDYSTATYLQRKEDFVDFIFKLLHKIPVLTSSHCVHIGMKYYALDEEKIIEFLDTKFSAIYTDFHLHRIRRKGIVFYSLFYPDEILNDNQIELIWGLMAVIPKEEWIQHMIFGELENAIALIDSNDLTKVFKLIFLSPNNTPQQAIGVKLREIALAEEMSPTDYKIKKTNFYQYSYILMTEARYLDYLNDAIDLLPDELEITGISLQTTVKQLEMDLYDSDTIPFISYGVSEGSD